VWKKETRNSRKTVLDETKRLERGQGAQILWVYRSRSRGISHQHEECFYNHRTSTAQSPSLDISTRTQQETIAGQNQQKKTNQRTDRVGGEKSSNLEASVTPHPTAYQRMGALKRHRVASREPRFEKETGTRREEAAAGHWDSAPPNQITTTITHANHHHDHPRKNKQRARDEKRNGKTQERNQALQPLEEDKR